MKNLRLFCGRPVIAYSVETALTAGCFDQVVVSTDSEEIADVARRLGATVPFMRPPELADDHTGTNEVVAHAVNWFHERGEVFEYAACIYATAPFLDGSLVRAGLDLVRSSGASYVVTVTTFPSPIQRAFRIDAGGRLEMFFPEYRASRSQDLEESFHDAGQLYWGTAGAFLSGEPLFGSSTVPLVIPRHRAQDIDTREDWDQAEILLKVLLQECDDT